MALPWSIARFLIRKVSGFRLPSTGNSMLQMIKRKKRSLLPRKRLGSRRNLGCTVCLGSLWITFHFKETYQPQWTLNPRPVHHVMIWPFRWRPFRPFWILTQKCGDSVFRAPMAHDSMTLSNGIDTQSNVLPVSCRNKSPVPNSGGGIEDSEGQLWVALAYAQLMTTIQLTNILRTSSMKHGRIYVPNPDSDSNSKSKTIIIKI